MTSTYNWKKSEKKVAEVLNTERTPFSGSTSGLTHSDTLHPNLYVEVKTKKKHAVKTLYDKTKIEAQGEGKVPLVILRESDSDEVLWVFEQQYIFEILKEIDLHTVNKKIPKKTTIDKLLQCGGSQEGMELHDLQKKLDDQMEEIVRENVLSKNNKELLRNLAVLSFYIETIKDFVRYE